jgi:hypothetical protein
MVTITINANTVTVTTPVRPFQMPMPKKMRKVYAAFVKET